jgi:hypothetical protein
VKYPVKRRCDTTRSPTTNNEPGFLRDRVDRVTARIDQSPRGPDLQALESVSQRLPCSPGLGEEMPHDDAQDDRGAHAATNASSSFAKRARQIVSERASGGFRRPSCREDGVEFDGFQLPVGQHLHERAAGEFRTAVPKP